MATKVEQLRTLTSQQDEVIGEMEGRISQMVEALERAADAGLTSVTAEEVRSLKAKLDTALAQNDAERAANKALEEERQRLRDIADRLRGLLDARDGRLGELEEQLERVMQGPRSVSAEHDYLVEQIDELKRSCSSETVNMILYEEEKEDCIMMCLNAMNVFNKLPSL